MYRIKKLGCILFLLLFTVSVAGCSQIQLSKPQPTTEVSPVSTTETVVESLPQLHPQFTETSNPESFGIVWDILVDNQVTEHFQRSEPIVFGNPENYFPLEGIPTFRGNPYRNSPSYGTANIQEKILSILWKNRISSLGEWSGCGWTGQPLMVRWDEKTKAIMNLYPEKKEKANLVEVIYATLDGNIYFYDLEDGTPTRDKINVGMTFKGTGSLDPRGYPVLYIGSGIANNGKTQRMYGISLIDGSILFEKDGADSTAFRSWYAFDSSPIIDSETDTIIWPGESGVLYTLKLNTNYDQSLGTLTIQPEEVVKTRYQTAKSNGGSYWHGYESSCVVVDRYLYISENGGMFFCIDLNTMELLWAQDTLDDSNSTPVFQWDGENGYLYTAPSLHWTAKGNTGSINIYKLNANTGEIVWQVPFDCHTIKDLSGGVQASPVLGKKGSSMDGLIIYPIAYAPGPSDGRLVALDTKTGNIVWEYHMPNYAWSSPAVVYDENETGYLFVADSAGNISMFDGATGSFCHKISLAATIEASPAIFENTLVVGTRNCTIFGVSIK